MSSSGQTVPHVPFLLDFPGFSQPSRQDDLQQPQNEGVSNDFFHFIKYIMWLDNKCNALNGV